MDFIIGTAHILTILFSWLMLRATVKMDDILLEEPLLLLVFILTIIIPILNIVLSVGVYILLLYENSKVNKSIIRKIVKKILFIKNEKKDKS